MLLKKIIRSITVTALFLLPIFPLIVANSYFFPFITGKAFFFRLIVEIAFAGWIMLAFMDTKYRPKLTALNVGITVFAFVALLADLLGVNPLRSIWSNFERMEGWITIVHLWALFIVSTSVFSSDNNGNKMWHRWLNMSLLVALITAIYGLVQLFGWANIHQGGTRLDASLGNSAYFAVYMLIHAFLAAYMYFVARTKQILNYAVLKWCYPILAILFGFLVFETQTRGTILGLIGGIMLSLLLYVIFAKKESKTSRYVSAGILFGIILLGAIFWMNRKAPIIQNSALFGRLASISWSEAKGQARNYIWPMAISGAMERPILGWGQENFNYIFNANYEPAMYAQEQWFDRAHSVFLDWLVATGIIGFLSYLSLYVLLLMKIWKSEFTIAEKSTLTGLIVGYAIHNIFVFDNIASYIMFFAILAFANSQLSKKERNLFGSQIVSKDAVEYIVAPIIIVCFVLVVYFVQYRVMTANSRLIDALLACSGNGTPDASLYEKALAVGSYTANQEIREQLISCGLRVISAQQAPGPLKQAFFTSTVNEIQNQIAATPKDARIYTLGGSFMNNIGQFPDALPLLEKAHELSPRKQSISLELMTTYLNLNVGMDKVIALAKSTYESAVSYSQAKSAYATTLVATGKEAEAKELFKDDLSAFNSPQIAQAYLINKQYSKAIEIYKILIKNNPSEIGYRAQLAQIQYTAGQKYEAIATLRAIAVDKPELKAQVEAAIKQIEK